MNSKWLEKYTQETKVLQQKGAGSKKMILVIVPIVMILLCVIPAAVNGDLSQEALIGFGAMIVVFALVIVMALALSKKRVKEDVPKSLRESLQKMLTTEEQVEEFDRQMMAEPLVALNVCNVQTMLITEDYLVNRNTFGGMPRYAIVRLSDVAYTNFAITGSGTKMMQKEYIVDLLNADKIKIMGFSVEGTRMMDAFEEALKTHCPNVVLKAR